MQQFNKVSTSSNFIKQLLNTTYLPVIRTILPGDFIIKGRQYLLSCSIIECTKSGYVEPYAGSTLSPIATFKTIGEYTFGEKNNKLCANFQSNCEGYDSRTHEKLGEYLRALRDMYGLNLMPLYNCFSNNTLANHHIFTDRVIKTSHDYRTKIYKVPIRFNTDYTVCIENVGETTFAPAFLRNDNLVRIGKTTSGTTVDMTNDYISVHSTDVISTYSGMRFLDPIKIRFNNVPEKIIINRVDESVQSKNEFIPIDINDNIEKYMTPFLYHSSDYTSEEKASLNLFSRTVNVINDTYKYDGDLYRKTSDINVPSEEITIDNNKYYPDSKVYYEHKSATVDSETIEWFDEVCVPGSDRNINPTSKGYYEIIDYNKPQYAGDCELVPRYTITYSLIDPSSENALTDNTIYYKSVSPAECGWMCKTSTTTDGITVEGEVYIATTDTYIHTNKEYYVFCPNKEIVPKEYNITEEEHCNKFDSIEDTLYLLIQVPSSYERNIVILEGDYTNCNSVKVFNEADLPKMSDSGLDNLFISNLKLLRMNTKTMTPYSDTLMQFLLWNAICNLDTINLDMDRLHSTLSGLALVVDSSTYANYWYYRYRQLISDLVRDNEITFIEDNLGYVTTEIESFMNGLSYDY